MKSAAKTTENWPEIVAEKDQKIAELETLVKYYEELLRLQKHRQFGASSEKSEYDLNQLSIFNEIEFTADPAVSEPKLIEVEKHHRKRTRLTNDRLPEDLPVEAMPGKRYCDKLFEFERAFAELEPDERLAKRQKFSKPLIDEFYTWVNSLKDPPKTGLGKAKHYALSQRVYLERVLLDGRLEISNNRAERSIKPFVIGRKNWLFANTVKGAKASSVIYSIVETAKENGLKPFEYLTFLLRTIPGATTGELDSLLPWGDAVPEGCRGPGTRD